MPYKKLGLIVDEKSAKLGLSSAREKQISLAADHSSICKFEDKDGDDYEQVIGNISTLAENAIKTLKERALLNKLSVPLASLCLKQTCT